jgi:predicted RecB family endonuclease
LNEAEAILIICAMLGDEPEARHRHTIDAGYFDIIVDCETDTQVIEVGLDKRSSLDSVQQADFAGWITGKSPMVLLVDTDATEGRFEFRIRTAATRLGVTYETISDEYLRRWQMTQHFRNIRAETLADYQ